MLKRVLHSPFTWLAVPAILIGLFWAVIATALEPLSQQQFDRVIAQIRQNAGTDTEAQWHHLRDVQWYNYANRPALVKRVPSLYLTLIGVYNAVDWQTLLAIADKWPGEYAALLEQLKAVFTRETIEDPHMLFAGWDNPHGIQMLASVGAVVEAKNGNSRAALENLRFAANTATKVVGQFGPYLPKYEWYNEAVESIAKSTTDTAVLYELIKLLDVESLSNQSAMRIIDSLPILNPDLRQYQVLRQTTQQVVWNALRIAGDYDKTYMQIAEHIDNSRNDPFNNFPFPWTGQTRVVNLAFRAMATTENEWADRIPAGYLNGLDGRDRFLGAALILSPRVQRNYDYMTRRIAASQNEILKAAVSARLYFLEHGRLPESLTELTEFGFEPADVSNVDNIRNVLSTDKNLPDEGQPFGALKLEKVMPTKEDLAAWLDMPDWIKAEDISMTETRDLATTETTTSVPITATIHAEFSDPPAEWKYYGLWISSLLERNDVALTSMTVEQGQNVAEFTKLSFIDDISTAGLAATPEFKQKVAERFVYVLADPADQMSPTQLRPDWPSIKIGPGKFKVTLELRVPQQLTKIYLPEEPLKSLAPTLHWWAKPVYLAAPIGNN